MQPPAPPRRWKIPLIAVGVLALAVALPVALVATGAPDLTAPPPLDRARLIPLPDGTEETLGDLMDGNVAPNDAPHTTEGFRGNDGKMVVVTIPPPVRDDIVAVARYHWVRGNLDLAEELFLRVPRSHPRWADAQRWLGWHVYADGRSDASRGVPYVNAALAADPLNGNAWQDAARTYLEALGIDQ